MSVLIILGYKLYGDNNMTDVLKNRLDKGAKMFNTGKYNNIIVSGGRVEKKCKHTQAYVMKDYFS